MKRTVITFLLGTLTLTGCGDIEFEDEMLEDEVMLAESEHELAAEIQDEPLLELDGEVIAFGRRDPMMCKLAVETVQKKSDEMCQACGLAGQDNDFIGQTQGDGSFGYDNGSPNLCSNALQSLYDAVDECARNCARPNSSMCSPPGCE